MNFEQWYQREGAALAASGETRVREIAMRAWAAGRAEQMKADGISINPQNCSQNASGECLFRSLAKLSGDEIRIALQRDLARAGRVLLETENAAGMCVGLADVGELGELRHGDDAIYVACGDRDTILALVANQPKLLAGLGEKPLLEDD